MGVRVYGTYHMKTIIFQLHHYTYKTINNESKILKASRKLHYETNHIQHPIEIKNSLTFKSNQIKQDLSCVSKCIYIIHLSVLSSYSTLYRTFLPSFKLILYSKLEGVC